MPFPVVTVVGMDWDDTSTPTVTLTFDQPVPVGDDVILCYGKYQGTVALVGVADTKGNTWDLIYYTNRGGTYWRGMWRCRVTNAIEVGDTVTVTLDINNTNKKLIALGVHGLADPPPVYHELQSYTGTQGDATQEKTWPGTLPKPGSLLVWLDAGVKTTVGTITPTGMDDYAIIERDDVHTLLVGWKIKPDASGYSTHTMGTTIADGGATSRATGGTSFQSGPLLDPDDPGFDPTGVPG